MCSYPRNLYRDANKNFMHCGEKESDMNVSGIVSLDSDTCKQSVEGR